MGIYKKTNHRITVKILDENNEELFEIPGRTSVDIGDIFTDSLITDVIKKAYGKNDLPKKFTVMAYNSFEFND